MLTRADLLADLTGRYGAWLTLTGRPGTDTPDGLGPAIDQALRGLGVEQADLATGEVPDGQEEAGLWLARRATLSLLAGDVAAIAVDLRVDAPLTDKKRSQYLTNLAALTKDVDAELNRLGISTVEVEYGWISLDFIEPYPTGASYRYGYPYPPYVAPYGR